MESVIGLYVTVDAMKGFSGGCYDMIVSYLDSVVKLKRISKHDGKIHRGCFLPVDSSKLYSLSLHSLVVQLKRRSCFLSNFIPFGKVVVSGDDILSNRFDTSQTQSLISLPEKSDDGFSLSVRIQRVYPDTVFSIPESLPIHTPCFLVLTVVQAEIVLEETPCHYSCRIVFPDDACFSTSPIYGRIPIWNNTIYLNNRDYLKGLRLAVEMYKHTSSLDVLVGRGRFEIRKRDLSPRRQGGCSNIMHDDQLVGKVVFGFSAVYCCSDCKREEQSVSHEEAERDAISEGSDSSSQSADSLSPTTYELPEWLK